ncbi:hypothetical protein ABLV66_16510 [Klebsiella sp. CN_Kp073]|uniref:hypothetical protein n=1 Tax=Klebsiella sp. CN_Kp073 TaxID=3153412 RepID=UPI0032B446C0
MAAVDILALVIMFFVLWSLVFGHWSLVIGLWSLVFGLWSLVFGLWSLVIGHWSLVIGHWSLVIEEPGNRCEYGLHFHTMGKSSFLRSCTFPEIAIKIQYYLIL